MAATSLKTEMTPSSHLFPDRVCVRPVWSSFLMMWADMWRKYVVPRLTYGLEVLTLRKKDLNSLESFQVRCAKQLQGLPTKTSNSAATALLGLLPVEACINKCVLTLFCNIVRDPPVH